MARYRVTLPEFTRFLARMTPEIRQACITGLRSGALRLQVATIAEIDGATPYPAVDTGELRNSVNVTPIEDGAIVHVDAPHAAVMEYGSRPHTPPLQPLLEWAQRKGLDAGAARAVQRKIATEGTAPRHYFTKAVERAKPLIREEILQELSRIGFGRVRGR